MPTPPSPFDRPTPTTAQAAALDDLSDDFDRTYDSIQTIVPRSAERTLALRRLEEAWAWAEKAILHDGKVYLQEETA